MPGFEIDKTQGIGSSTITVTPTEMNQTSSNYTRYLKVTFSDGTISSTTLTHSAGSYTYKYTFSVTPQVIPIDSTGGSYTVNVTSIRETYLNDTLVATDENWGYSISQTDGITWSGTTFTIGANYNSWDTTTVVRFTQNTSGNIVEIIIQSLAADVSDEYTFTASDISATATAGSTSLTVTSTKTTYTNGTAGTTSTVGWSITSYPSWVTVSGQTVSWSENTSTSSRTGSIVLTQEESGYTTTITITQAAATTSTYYVLATYDRTDTGSSYSGGTSYVVTMLSRNGGSLSLSTAFQSYKSTLINGSASGVKTGVGYSVQTSSLPSWITNVALDTSNMDSSTGTGTLGVTITYAANTESSNRSADIAIIQDESGYLTYFRVTQAAAESSSTSTDTDYSNYTITYNLDTITYEYYVYSNNRLTSSGTRSITGSNGSKDGGTTITFMPLDSYTISGDSVEIYLYISGYAYLKNASGVQQSATIGSMTVNQLPGGGTSSGVAITDIENTNTSGGNDFSIEVDFTIQGDGAYANSLILIDLYPVFNNISYNFSGQSLSIELDTELT